MAETAQTGWRSPRVAGAGRGALLFGRMFEDPSIERSLFPPGARIFCIASAGCTALELAASGYDVTAVDLNPAQIAYVRARIAGGGTARGSVDRLLGAARRTAPFLGIGRDALHRFLLLDDPEEQLRRWRGEIHTPRLRRLIRVLLSSPMLRLLYASPLVRSLPADFGALLQERLERGFALHPNRTNPYAWRLLAGDDPPDLVLPRPARPPRLAVADAAEYLAAVPAGSFDGFTLSNILDGADASYRSRLDAALRHAAAPGAVALIRSFGEPDGGEEAELAAADRSLLWGSVATPRFD